MQEFLYRIQPTRVGMLVDGPTEEEALYVRKHFSYLEKLSADGVVLMAGRTMNDDEDPFGIVIFVAASVARAQEIMRNDPAVLHGVMKAELFPFSIAIWSQHRKGHDFGGT